MESPRRGTGPQVPAAHAVANQTLKLTSRGDRITMTYDELNRQTAEQFPDNRRNTFSYDPVGNRTVIVDATGVYTTTYSARNETLSVVNPVGKRTTYTYDPPQDRRHTMLNPDSGGTTYVYDGKDRLRAQQNPQNQTTTLTYDAADRETAKIMASGLRVSMVYNAAGWLTRKDNLESSGTAKSVFTYTYDKVGNRLTEQALEGMVTTWTYDKTYQLTREQRGPT